MADTEAPTRAAPLTPDRMESLALALIEEEGIEGFSIRKLADRLGCKAMSLYHHYPSKAHLMDAMLDRVLADLPLPPPDLPWRERLARAARAFHRIALAHPRFFPFFSTHRMNTRAGLIWLDGMLGLFRDAGFDEEQAARLFRAFGYFLMGAGLDETAGYSKGPSATAADAVLDAEVARVFPNVAAAGPFFRPGEREATFELGLALLLDGAEQILEARP
ncbi:TetR/AcrR family transcriptional regulator [Sphingomonas sp. LB-2]|uniref:TetR/AcrR family transcriptional regulator n=1 Tax=Sphingomonas caeni TaxID=2984949 RepID=UPI002231ADB1|nr:TetR/AcrR family transcriptional regulator [Sphingomonas caeni]MCW3846440.1 TetR/AcrR family transcriptional regulator [Sphingomonas caeni]